MHSWWSYPQVCQMRLGPVTWWGLTCKADCLDAGCNGLLYLVFVVDVSLDIIISKLVVIGCMDLSDWNTPERSEFPEAGMNCCFSQFHSLSSHLSLLRWCLCISWRDMLLNSAVTSCSAKHHIGSQMAALGLSWSQTFGHIVGKRVCLRQIRRQQSHLWDAWVAGSTIWHCWHTWQCPDQGRRYIGSRCR